MELLHFVGWHLQLLDYSRVSLRLGLPSATLSTFRQLNKL